MKLIVSNLKTFSTYVTREFHFIMMELISSYGWTHIETWKLWNGPGTVRAKLIEESGELPETILFWESHEFMHAHAEDIYRLDCNKYLLIDDLHWWNEQMRRIKVVSFELCDTILSTYKYILATLYPEIAVSKKVVWIPHSASPDFLIDYNPHPENSLFISGAITRSYPLRQHIKMLHALGSYSTVHQSHPGYRSGYDYKESAVVGRRYAERINRYRAGFTDSSIFKYIVAKYFEIPATGALLFADNAVSEPLKELGFVENEHYFPVSKENLEERIRYILDERNHEALDKIRRRGQELVWARHKTSDRAREINKVCVG